MKKRGVGLVVVCVTVLIGLVFYWRLVQTPASWAEEVPPADSPSTFPEGSSSVIESLTWQITGNDQTTLYQQAKKLLEGIREAMIVKETGRLLVVSLPTKELPALRQSLHKLGTVNAPDAEGSAPTTLLRLTFTQP